MDLPWLWFCLPGWKILPVTEATAHTLPLEYSCEKLYVWACSMCVDGRSLHETKPMTELPRLAYNNTGHIPL